MNKSEDDNEDGGLRLGMRIEDSGFRIYLSGLRMIIDDSGLRIKG